MPEPQEGHENIERLLGRVLEATERADSDRAAFRSETSASLGLIQQQLNGLAALPPLFASHEILDQHRHTDNLGRFDKLEERMGNLETAQAEHQGIRKGVGLGIAVASAAGGGGIFAALTALAKKWGWLALALCILGTPRALAKAPEVTDPAYRSWFDGLTNPATGLSCCNTTDGHIVDMRDVQVFGNDYLLRIAGVWRVVPRAAILDRIDNPVGTYVAFYSRAADSDPSVAPMIFCFIRPALT